MVSKSVRTRFAPSPTGIMHIGGVRTALFAWAYAKNQGGEFILRIEDTDKSREVKGSIAHIEESLKWLGIDWDEGPIKQSERLDIYKEWAEKLIKKGLAYTDPYSPEEVQAFREKAKQEKRPFLFRNHRPQETTAADDWYMNRALRFRTPEIKSYKWHDKVRGELSAGEGALDDFIIIKADGYPTYNFAHVIDDHLMEITHVMRGEEFIPSMPNYLALHEALEMPLPKFATMPPILGKQGGKKLSKRDGAKDALVYRDEGYLPAAVANFIASLGWNDGTEKELYSLEEIVEKFSLKRIQRSGARFDEEKLNWINWLHMDKLIKEDPLEAICHLERYFGFDGHGADTVFVQKAIALAATKARDSSTLVEQLNIFTEQPSFELNEASLSQIDQDLTIDTAKEYLGQAHAVLEQLGEFRSADVETSLRQAMNDLQASPRVFLNLVRWAISGRKVSPNMFEMITLLGKEETLTRLSL